MVNVICKKCLKRKADPNTGFCKECALKGEKEEEEIEFEEEEEDDIDFGEKEEE